MTTPTPSIPVLRNRLDAETSPYLRQHAGNPVHWLPWGDEAFELARRLDRPVFLSVGYATCHWCHVMKRESFESVAMAERLNADFISIKVDREERPDVDAIYMNALQRLNRGAGGWPMSIFLEPDARRPFLAGTYFPPVDGAGRPGFGTVLRQVREYWTGQRAAVLRQAALVGDAVAEEETALPPVAPLTEATVAAAVEQVFAIRDPDHGGFGRGPAKFPNPVNLELLLEAGWASAEVRRFVVQTLGAMSRGGIHDHVGGGFHRYSTDPEWVVPHFEKMLSDNGLLLSLYARGVERTTDPAFLDVIERTAGWLRRSMQLEHGAFAAAMDAEADGREGGPYVWSRASVIAAAEAAGLGADVDRILAVYAVADGPNFRDPHDPSLPPGHVLRLRESPASLAAGLGLDEDAFAAWRQRVDEALRTARDRLPQPARDDTVLAGWNGHVARGLADAGRITGDTALVSLAADAMRFVLDAMRRPDGTLVRAWREGAPVPIEAPLEDHAAVARGLLALFAATDEAEWLVAAAGLMDAAAARFRDAGGGWWDTAAGRPDLFVRLRTTRDGAEPAGVTAAILADLAIGEAAGEPARIERAAADLRVISGAIAERPGAAPGAVLAVRRLLERHPAVAAGLARGPATGTSGPSASGVAGAVTSATSATGIVVRSSHPAIVLGEGEAATIRLSVTVPEGLHLNATVPDDPGLEALVVSIVGGRGVEAVAELPEPAPGPGGSDVHRVYAGTLAIPVRVRRTGPVTGEPRLALRLQVCGEDACLPAETLEAPVTITAAG